MNNRRMIYMNLLDNIFLRFALWDERSGHALARIVAVALTEISAHLY